MKGILRRSSNPRPRRNYAFCRAVALMFRNHVRVVVVMLVMSLLVAASASAPLRVRGLDHETQKNAIADPQHDNWTQSQLYRSPAVSSITTEPPLLNAPTNLTVSAASSAGISLSWTAPTGVVDHYEVERSESISGPFLFLGNVFGTTHNDTTVTNLHAYVYRVRAMDAGNVSSAPSNLALGTAISFEFSQLQGQRIKAQHVHDLRTAINAIRAVANLLAATWARGTLNGLEIKGTDVLELRSKLGEALTALDIPIAAYEDPILSTGANGTRIKAIHIEQLQARSTRGSSNSSGPLSADQSCDQGATIGASASVSVYKADVNDNLADYGVIFQDASQEVNPDAWDSARDALLRKIDSTIAADSQYHPVVNKTVGPYQGWLEGANVSLIMASGLLLADRGRLTRPLDSAIRRVIGSYVFNRDAGCGFSYGRWRGQNNCMDDYTVAAIGYAWIAAYKYKRGDGDVSYYVDAAKNTINLALGLEESVCAYRTGSAWSPTSSRGPCNATVNDLQMGLAEVVSLNHGQQTIAYGLGLMTSVSSAFIGLQTANAAPALTLDQKVVALALFREGQNHTVAGGDTFDPTGCYTFTPDRTAFQLGAHCGDVGGGYKPKMFPVKNFYTQVLNLTPPESGYQFDVFEPGLFNDGFFNKGRQVVYGDLTKCWYPSTSRPALGGTPVTPPLADVAWVKPAYVTWGTPDTLTVAGYARNGSGGVQMRWRDVTTGAPEQVVSFQATPAADGSWSNTIPSSNHCHDYEVYVNYSGSTSNTFFYSGIGSGYCPEVARLTWIQPQWSAGFGPPGSLVVAGNAANAPAGTTVKLYWRDLSGSTPNTWNLIDFTAPVGSDGSWYNSIPNVNYSHVYELYAKYDAFASRTCRYNGNQLLNWCEANSAAPSAGATVTASSTYNSNYPVSAVNNGDRKGINWGAGGGWNDATGNIYPDSMQVDFFGMKTIDQVNVFTLQDNYGNPVEPVEALTFTAYGLTNFSVEYWDGFVGTWKPIPDAVVAGNNKVWTRFLFSPVPTSKIRVVVTGALFSHSRITEVEAWGIPPSKSNHASTVNGGLATASSTFSTAYPAAAAINGDRKGLNWGAGGGWNDATWNAFPDWLQVKFAGARTIDEINVFTLQDNYSNPADPTEMMTFSAQGITAFEVQYDNGSTWVTVPGGSVFGNNKVWRKFNFAPVTTAKIRVLVNNGLSNFSRITEVEALGW